MKLKDTQPEITKNQKLGQNHKKIIGIEKISEIDFSSRSCIFIKKKPPASSFKKVKHKNKKPAYFIILNDLL